MKIDRNFYKYAFALCFLGLFIFTYIVRQQIIYPITQRTYLWGINYLVWAGFILFLCSRYTREAFGRKWPFILPILFALPLALYSIRLCGQSFGFFAMYSSSCIFSLLFLFIELEGERGHSCIKWMLIVLDILIILLVIWAVLDISFHKIILRQVAKFMTVDDQFRRLSHHVIKSTQGKRFYSFFGHALPNSVLLNYCYALNLVYSERSRKHILHPLAICAITFVGIACCGSKTGLAVTLLLTVIYFYKSLKAMLAVGAGLVVLILSGLMNNLIERILTRSLTTGRAEQLLRLLGDARYPFHFLYGYGESPPEGYTPAAFEFPFVTFAFNYGILLAILLVGTPVVYCTIKLCRKGTFKVWLFWVLLFAQVNTFTCLAQDKDNALIFYFLTMVMLNIPLVCSDKESCRKRGVYVSKRRND